MTNFRSKPLLHLASECENCQFCGVYAPKAIVGCHPNGLKYGKGTGQKAHDLVAFLCPECHNILDGRAGTLTRFERDAMFLESFYSTMLWAFKDGRLRVVA